MSKRVVSEAWVEDIEKQRLPTKHYVYIIHVNWDNDSNSIIRRRYSHFFDLQVALLERFFDEGGGSQPSIRTIPFLPSKIFFRRSHVRNVALERLVPLSEYVKSIVVLPKHISQSDTVLNFFEPSNDDLKYTSKTEISTKVQNADEISEPMCLEEYIATDNFQKESSNEINLNVGDVVDVVEKLDAGWWLVTLNGENGYVPCTHLKRKDEKEENLVIFKTVIDGKKYICNKMFNADNPDEISIDKGCIVEVLEQSYDGWWLVKYKNKVGRVPAIYLSSSDTLTANCLLRREKKDKDIKINSVTNDTKSNFKDNEVNCYTATNDYDSKAYGGMDLKKGQVVKVIDRSSTGWWYVEFSSCEGWVPESYLEKKVGKVKPPIPKKPK